jgi:transglutaminase-like putative cysteine protease
MLHLGMVCVLECGMRKNAAFSLTGLILIWLVFSSCQASGPLDTPLVQEPGSASQPGEEVETLDSAAMSVQGSQDYEVVETFQIANRGPGSPDKHNLWAALIRDVPPYQQVMEMTISTQNYRTFEDESGNLIAEFDLSCLQPGENILIEIHYQIRVNQIAYDLSKCQGELPTAFTTPELHIESNNPQIHELALELGSKIPNPCEQVRSFYDYVGDNLVYTYNGKDWGAQAALGEMGADCSEYSDLMIALSRTAGIPARYLEGLLYLQPTTQGFARREHAWLEVFLPNIGWVPMDPTLGRSLSLRDKYFAANTLDHIIVTRGRNPSALRGASYYTHIYWPGPSTEITIEKFGWEITPLN